MFKLPMNEVAQRTFADEDENDDDDVGGEVDLSGLRDVGRVPVDTEGFVVSFDADTQSHEIREFFDKYGFVCIRNVLNDAEIDDTLEAFFKQFDKNDVASIEEFYRNQRFGRLGIIGMFPDFRALPLLENRQNPKVYDAFRVVLNDDKLIVDHDRLGAMRPSVVNGVDHAEWRTIDKWIHLDCNPLAGTVSVGSFDNGDGVHDWKKCFLVQGFITLTDARDEDGGFHCVPGGHKVAAHWAKRNKLRDHGSTLQVAHDDALRAFVQKISIRRGCLLTWNAWLFHGNRPNYSGNWRIVQYIRMYPADKTPFTPLVTNTDLYPKEFKMSPLGRRLFGIDKW